VKIKEPKFYSGFNNLRHNQPVLNPLRFYSDAVGGAPTSHLCVSMNQWHVSGYERIIHHRVTALETWPHCPVRRRETKPWAPNRDHPSISAGEEERPTRRLRWHCSNIVTACPADVRVGFLLVRRLLGSHITVSAWPICSGN
jgi:hypothetical protein